MKACHAAAIAVVLGVGAGLLDACSGAQARSQAQLAAIRTGCLVSLQIERDAGEAGAENETAEGCAAALHSWEKHP